MPQVSRSPGQMGFTLSTDDVVEITRVTPDEHRFREEQRTKRAEEAEARKANARRRDRLITLWPARRCARCEHWDYPSAIPAPKNIEVNPFGDCYAMKVLRERSTAIRGSDKGMIVLARRLKELAEAGFPVQSEPLRTQGWFSCGQFEEVTDARRDPDADLPIADAIAEEDAQWAS